MRSGGAAWPSPICMTRRLDKPLRLIQKVACYGPLRTGTHDMLHRCVDGLLVSAVTVQCLDGLTERLAAAGKTTLLVVWDNAPWHVCHAMRE